MRLIVAAVVTVGVVWAGSASAMTNQAKPQPASPKVLHPKWRLIWRGANGLSADGRYVLIQFQSVDAVVLIDDQTGQQTALSPPSFTGPTGRQTNCYVVDIRYPWVFAHCSDGSTALYSIPQQGWRTVPGPAGYLGGGPGGDRPSAVGRYWIEWARFVWRGPCCTDVSFYYQNIASGQVQRDPTTATTVPNLDSPVLASSVCRPLRVPASYNDHAQGLGSLTRLADGFVLARSQLPPAPPPNLIKVPSGVRVFLERCGSRLHRAIAEGPAANKNMVAWPTPNPSSQLAGLLLPGLRQFVIQTPFVASRYSYFGTGLVAGSRHLYAQVATQQVAASGQGYQVWEAESPPAG